MSRNAISDALRALSSIDVLPHRYRPLLLRRAGVRIGARTLLMSGIRFARSAPITIGDGCYINYNTYFDAAASIVVGDNTSIGDHVRIITSTHQIGPSTKRAGASFGEPVVIGSGVWIGSGATVLPGVSIGSGCIVAAGAVVTSDCAPNGRYAGVPARRKTPDLD